MLYSYSSNSFRREDGDPVQAVDFAGRGSAWLERLVRDQEVGGSNPLAPTNLFKHLNTQLGFVLAFLTATGPKISSIFFAACFCPSNVRCVYISCVVRTDAWPSKC